jgi:hypothetical protein
VWTILAKLVNAGSGKVSLLIEEFPAVAAGIHKCCGGASLAAGVEEEEHAVHHIFTGGGIDIRGDIRGAIPTVEHVNGIKGIGGEHNIIPAGDFM